MEVKVMFTRAQRSFIAGLFVDDLMNCKYYKAMGATMKAMLGETVRFFYTPEDTLDSKLPPVKCEESVKKDKEGTIKEHKYIFNLELLIPGFTKDFMTLNFKREIDKSVIDNVV